jgi:hypothetical protein
MVLENLEDKTQVETKMLDDGSLKGFSPVELNRPEAPQKKQMRITDCKPRKYKPRSIAGSTKYYGVSLNNITGKYKAQVSQGGAYKWLGEYVDEVAAARAVDAELIRRGLEVRNFPVISARQQNGDQINDINFVYSCKECGADYEAKPDTCEKCGKSNFEKTPKI